MHLESAVRGLASNIPLEAGCSLLLGLLRALGSPETHCPGVWRASWTLSGVWMSHPGRVRRPLSGASGR